MAKNLKQIKNKAVQLTSLDKSIIYPVKRIRLGIILTLIGLLVFLLGARPDILGMDRSPVIGFVQITVMLVGLAIICIGGYVSMISLWFKRTPSIAAETGLRLISTGYVVAVISGMADIIGFGSHPFPYVVPYFGIWQARGVQIGEGIIAIGLLLMFPYSRSALFNGNHDHPAQGNHL